MYRTIALATILLLMSVTAFAVDEPEPVLYFPFDNDEGDEVIDLSGNENNGEIPLNGDFVEGKYNNGISLEGPDTIDVDFCVMRGTLFMKVNQNHNPRSIRRRG